MSSESHKPERPLAATVANSGRIEVLLAVDKSLTLQLIRKTIPDLPLELWLLISTLQIQWDDALEYRRAEFQAAISQLEAQPLEPVDKGLLFYGLPTESQRRCQELIRRFEQMERAEWKDHIRSLAHILDLAIQARLQSST